MKIYSVNYLRQNSAFPDAEGFVPSSFLNCKKSGSFSSPITFKANINKAVSASSGFMSGAKKFFAKHFMTEGVTVADYSKLVRDTDALVGEGFLKSRIEEFQKLAGDDASRFIQLDGNKLTVYDRKVSGKLLSGLLDTAKLPFDILRAAIKGVANLPFIKGTSASDALKNIPFIKKRANEKASMDLYYKIKGVANLNDKPFEIRQKILSVPAENAVGNYNTKDERGLNRLATGAISSFFVGMDFYNLVMYEKNNKEEAQKAGKKRRNRELMRIGINAFMTYSVLGALSSYANKSKAFACAAIAGSALFAEVITRVIAGTPLLPLSPEGAKKYNEKRRQKGQKEDLNGQQPARMPSNINGGGVFGEFINYRANLGKKEVNKTKKRETKSPITPKRVLLAVAAVTLANILYGVARSKMPKFDGFIKKAEDTIAKFYEKHSTEDLIVNSEKLRKLLEGFDGNRSDSIKQAYSRILDVSFTQAEAERLMAASKDGIISITNDDKIFAKAFRRTSGNIQDGTKDAYQRFKTIDFQIDFENPKTIDGATYYPMKNAQYNFGNIKETKIKILLDAASYPLKAIKNILTAPGNLIKKLGSTSKKAKPKVEPPVIPDIGELYKDCSFMFKKYESGKITKEEFAKYMDSVNTKFLNTDTTPTYPQTALASLSRNFVTLITSYFFINDFRNEVLIQSNGENTQKAKEVTNERIAHKLSNFVLNKFFMELFNSTFQKYYLGSLAGATAVAAATEATNESCVRLSIGVPIGNMGSKEEIEEFEKKHLEKKGITGAYYRMMARLTGKKMLSEKAESK